MSRPGARPTSSRSSRSGGDLGRLALDVALAGRDLEQLGVDGGPVLAHQHDLVAEHRHDRHRARVVHDVALEALAVGETNVPTPTEMIPPR